MTYLHPRTSSARWCASGFNIAVGVRLLMPDNIVSTNPVYRVLDSLVHGDGYLGAALLAFGLVMLASLFTDAYPAAVGIVTGASLLTWLAVAVALGIETMSQIGSLAYLLAVAVNAFAFWHLRAYQEGVRDR